MTDQERIAKLRDGTWDHTIMRGPNPTGFCVDETPFAQATADRIEELVKERDEAQINHLAWKLEAEATQASLNKAVEALREIAAEALVPVHTKKHGGISNKKMYTAWRALAVKRIDRARAVLAELEEK